MIRKFSVKFGIAFQRGSANSTHGNDKQCAVLLGSTGWISISVEEL